MTPAATANPASPRASLAATKQLSTLHAQAALAGVELVAIEGDDGGAELLLTRGAATRRFHDFPSARAAVCCDEAHD